MGHYEVAQMVRRKYGDRVRDLLWARVCQVGSGISFHVEVRRRWQLEDHQNASDVEKRARRRMKSDTNLKLAPFPTRSPLPVAALPSMSLIPSAPFTNSHGIIQQLTPALGA